MSAMKRILFVLAGLAAFWTATVALAVIVIRGPVTPPAGGGSGTWHDLTSFAGTDASEDLGDDAYLVWFPWTGPANGNATKFRFKVGAYTANTNVKIGLYSIGGSLLVSGATASPVTATGTYEITIASTAVVSGTSYFLAVIGDNYPGGIQIAYKTAVGQFYYGDGAVAYYTMPSSMPAQSGSDAKTYAIGVYIE